MYMDSTDSTTCIFMKAKPSFHESPFLDNFLLISRGTCFLNFIISIIFIFIYICTVFVAGKPIYVINGNM